MGRGRAKVSLVEAVVVVGEEAQAQAREVEEAEGGSLAGWMISEALNARVVDKKGNVATVAPGFSGGLAGCWRYMQVIDYGRPTSIGIRSCIVRLHDCK